MLQINRIYETIGIYEERIKTIPKAKNDKLFKELNISPLEIVNFQNTKSILFASNKISLDVANFIYQKLRDYAKTSLAERIVLTLLHKECIELKRKL